MIANWLILLALKALEVLTLAPIDVPRLLWSKSRTAMHVCDCRPSALTIEEPALVTVTVRARASGARSISDAYANGDAAYVSVMRNLAPYYGYGKPMVF